MNTVASSEQSFLKPKLMNCLQSAMWQEHLSGPLKTELQILTWKKQCLPKWKQEKLDPVKQ